MESISTASIEPTRSLRIFVVDSHADTRATYSLYLAALGHTMIAAASLTEALAALPSASCNMLISELRLPDGNGCELLTRLHLPPSIYALAVSTSGMASDREKSRVAGFRHHLLKPFRLPEFEAILEEVARELGATESTKN